MPLSVLWGYLFLAAALLAASLIDIEHFLIPDKITFSGMVVAVLLAAAFPMGRIGSDIVGLPGGDQVITGGLLAWFRPLGEMVEGRARVTAVLDALVGMAVGYAMLWALLEAGRRLWGRAKVRLEEPVEAVLTAAGLRVDAFDLDWEWEDLLIRRSDRFKAGAVEVSGMDDVHVPEKGELQLIVSADSLQVGDRTVSRESIGTIRAQVTHWEHPREVMGYGDLKLLAMIGAFQGPDACVFVLMLGALAGCAWGVSRLLCGNDRGPLPFGPFLAAGAMAWLFFGRTFVLWYGSLLRPF